jgi:hypothetical protein
VLPPKLLRIFRTAPADLLEFEFGSETLCWILKASGKNLLECNNSYIKIVIWAATSFGFVNGYQISEELSLPLE